ncbi:MAG: preprotein translocase subunit YajC [Gammaproteobacteria bacterium]|nr:preprotein translocase subunit YajC [Gammaproteobacteria bacterium]
MNLLETLIPAAHAATDSVAGTTGTSANPFGSFAFLAVIMVVFYFLLWRPQSKRAKQHRDLITNLKVGDEVITSGGILGRVDKVNDSFLVVTLAKDLSVHVQKSAISSVVPKGTLETI